MGADRPTGAIIDGNCPGCGRRIVGMMPERCFICGHSFTEAIRAQNPNFQPTPGYKSPVGDVQDEIREAAEAEAASILDPDGVWHDKNVGTDPFEQMASAINSRLDDQRDIGKEIEKRLGEVAEKYLGPFTEPNDVVLVRFEKDLRAAVPGIDVRHSEISTYYDTADGQNKKEIKAIVDYIPERIVEIEIRKVGLDQS